MKKILITALAIIGMVFAFSGCSKDDEPQNGFDYPLETLYGTWRVTHVEQKDGTMFDVTTSVAEKVFKPTYATFNVDGTYSGRGYFGNGAGTYKALGKTITCFIDGTEYLKYDVLSLSGTQCELKMYESGSTSSIKIRCKKQ